MCTYAYLIIAVLVATIVFLIVRNRILKSKLGIDGDQDFIIIPGKRPANNNKK